MTTPMTKHDEAHEALVAARHEFVRLQEDLNQANKALKALVKERDEKHLRACEAESDRDEWKAKAQDREVALNAMTLRANNLERGLEEWRKRYLSFIEDAKQNSAALTEAEPKLAEAAVAYVKRQDGKLLCVWNKRYGGWAFPGGKVEEGETQCQAMVRELKEETGIEALDWKEIYGAPHNTPMKEARGSFVYVFQVDEVVIGLSDAREMEPGCPVTWLTREEFLKWTPFRAFYEKMFELGIG